VPCLSGALVAAHRGALGGPVVEVEDLPAPALAGLFRAARHTDAIVAVAVSAAVRTRAPDAARAAVDAIARAARDAQMDRPVVMVARAVPADVDAQQALYRDLDAGFTSFEVADAAFGGAGAALATLCEPLLEHELGVEVEITHGSGVDAGLSLSSIDDALSAVGLHLAAVRGARADDELAGALLVTDGTEAVVRVPHRLVVTPRIEQAYARVDPADHARIEHRTFDAAEALLEQIGARGVASRFLDALARGAG
jgi:hypothetical protein